MIKKNNDQIEAQITITMLFESEEKAQAINAATAPENIETPKTVLATSSICGRKLFLNVHSKGSIKDLLITVEDYMEKIDLSSTTINTALIKE